MLVFLCSARAFCVACLVLERLRRTMITLPLVPPGACRGLRTGFANFAKFHRMVAGVDVCNSSALGGPGPSGRQDGNGGGNFTHNPLATHGTDNAARQ